MNGLNFYVASVAGGWQTAVRTPDGRDWPFGPVMNNVTDLWDWQRNNLFADQEMVD